MNPDPKTEDLLVDHSANESLAEYEAILSEMRRIITPPREKTIFSVGGRGYYENPASDILAFFMDPTAEHGLGLLFLSAFLDCMHQENRPSLDGIVNEAVKLGREVVTEDDKRIDFLITTPDWCLVIENKIRHDQVNPFDIYEKYAYNVNPKVYFAILSPNGKSVKEPLWHGVSYKKYLKAVREKLGKHSVDAPLSKWSVLAREFIVHIENELYRPLMNEKQASFIEKHTNEIAKLKQLESEYRNYLLEQLREALCKFMPIDSLSLKDEGWGIRCYCCSLWGRSNLALWRNGENFMVTAYLVGPTVDQRKRAFTFFNGMTHGSKGAELLWYPEPGFETREKAIAEFIRFSQFYTELLKPSPEPVQPLGEMLKS